MTVPFQGSNLLNVTPPKLPAHPYDILSAGDQVHLHYDLPQKNRLQSGIYWESSRSGNCNTVGVWDEVFCTPVDDRPEKESERAEDSTYPPVTVFARDECGIFDDDEFYRANALQALKLKLPIAVGQHAAGLLADRADALTAVTDITEAVGSLEEALGLTGAPGVIHAPRRLAAVIKDTGLVKQDGNSLVTVLGNQFVFGGGYSGIAADTLYATGPVHIYLNDPIVRTTVDAATNLRTAIAERTVVVAWECPESAWSVSYA